jgi:hypothetical protein
LLRRVQCTEGELQVDATYAPRPEYGLIYPILEVVTGGITARGGASRLLLSGRPVFILRLPRPPRVSTWPPGRA